MAQFLSEEWIETLDAELRHDERAQAAASDVRLTIGQIVTGGPNGEVSYVLRVGDGEARVEPDGIDDADVTFTQDHATATAIAQGALAAQAAFMEGRVRVGGDLSLLMANAPALAGIDDALARARARTTY